jgi:hypothetical protein
VDFAEVEGAVGVFDVTEDAAGADGGELLIITDEPDTRPAVNGVLDGDVEGHGVGHHRLVDDHQGCVGRSWSPLPGRLQAVTR